MIAFDNISFLVFIPLAMIFLFFFIRHTFVKGSEKKKLRWYVILTRFLIVTILIIALSAPYTVTKTTEQKQSNVNILLDKSKSMSLFQDDSDILINKINSLTDLNVNLITIGSDYNSPIGNALLNNMIGNDNILLLSDGNSNRGKDLQDVLSFASTINSTVNIVELNPKNNDASIAITGSKYVLSGLSNPFYIEIDAVGTVNYNAVVKLDGKIIKEFSGKESTIEELELSLKEGNHKLEAELITTDHNQENNIFYKTITVLEKPRVLYVSSQISPMDNIFKEIYDLDVKPSIPNNLDQYFGVIINDQPASVLESQTQKLTNYVLEGNGLMVIGGSKSYDLGSYDSSQFQTLLPTKVGVGEIENVTDLNIVLIIDISVSSGIETEAGTVVNIEKAQAINVFNQLHPKDYLGVVAFNKEAHIISELRRVEQQVDTPAKISKLQNQGGTYMETGLIEAEKMLENAAGNKNVIIISDGKTKNPSQVSTIAQRLKKKGITVFTVGVGPATDEEYMDALAIVGGGTYFKTSSLDKLSIVFGKERSVDKKEWMLVPFNQQHFIMNGVDLNAKIYGFNQVVPKATAQMLVSTDSGNPILTTWRFGLGRVVSLTTDGGNKWGGNMLKEGNSVVISRAANWAVGDPRRKESLRLSISDGKLYEDLDFTMYSEKVPTLKGVDLVQKDVNLYTGTIKPDSTGFFQIENEEFAINYPREYQELGLNSDLESIVQITGGTILNVNDPEEIVEKIKKDNQREIEDKNYFRHFYLPLVIIIYLIEILLRRKIKK